MARILMVDDMASIRRIVKVVLQEEGYQTDEADSGVAGYQRATAIDYDLIISDWNMPRGTGTEMVRELKRNAKTAHVPIIMLTAEAEKSRILELAKLGVAGYILKPFKPEVLIKAVARALEARDRG
jgi:two-component system chemotaxis response regulator CheY